MSHAPRLIFILFFISQFSLSSSAQITKNNCPDDEAFCEGFKFFENGNTYDGEMVYGIPHGKGLMKFSGGDEYLGEFIKGKMHGKGAILLVNGDSYHGQWQEGEAHGDGTYRKSDGSNFSGKFKNGMREGKAIMTWKNGDTLKGTWQDDKLNGKAIFEFANGDRLETSWKEGRMRVKSVYVKEDGQRIKGSLNTIYLVTDVEDDFAESKEAITKNLQTAWISAAMEFKAIQNYDLAIDFLMAAQKYGPVESEQSGVIVQELKSIDTQKNNSGWAQLPKE